MKRKIFLIILAALFCVSLSACGAAAAETNVDSSSEDQTQDSADTAIDTSNAISISLKDGGTSSEGDGVNIDGDTITITSEGSYLLSGTLTDGQIIVDADKDSNVILALSGASVSCSDSAAIYVARSGNVTINLAEGTENQLSVTGEYVQTDDNTVDAAIFSKSDLTVTGSGALEINAEYGHGIVSKDNLTISGGTYTISAESHGLSGKGSVTVEDGVFDITCGEDAIHSSNTDDDTLGWVTVSGGDFTIAAGDDGIHAETALTISGGTFDITECYEGLEGKSVTVEGGSISVVASDDGINAAGGDGSSDWGMIKADDSCFIKISDGELNIDAAGDGLDSNGSLYISGGTTYLSGPTDNGNGALDYTSEGTITGGIIIAAGSSGMAMNFDQNSTQGTILYNFSVQQAAGTQITLSDADGNILAEYAPEKQYQSVVISTPEVASDGTYSVTVGAESYEITMSGLVYGSGGTGGMGEPGGDRTGGTRPDAGQAPGTPPKGMISATTATP